MRVFYFFLGSESAILTDLEDIWTMAIQNELEIPKSEFPRHRVVLIIPALYRRTFVKQYMTTLLVKMGFGHAFLTLDHVSAAFGAGLSEWQPFFKAGFPPYIFKRTILPS